MYGDGDRSPTDLTPADRTLLAELRGMWRERDPEPADLADRVVFALSLDLLEYELLRIQQQAGELAGARSAGRSRTLTLTGDNLTVLLGLTPTGATTRLDGWISGGDCVLVELRGEREVRREPADGTGRFVFEGVTPGLVQLVILPAAGSSLGRPVVTPTIRV
jgi:hypothetical protein